MNQSRGSSALKEIARSTRDLYAATDSDLPLACRSQLGLAMRSPPKPPAPSPFAMQHELADARDEDCGIFPSGRCTSPIAAKEMVWASQQCRSRTTGKYEMQRHAVVIGIWGSQ
jgi:hypothetical protein